jgi:hypothetical protein
MFERGMNIEDVKHVLDTGEIIREYPDDAPYPSRLILGFVGERPLHVVVAENSEDRETIVITVYEPDIDKWKDGFRGRKHL